MGRYSGGKAVRVLIESDAHAVAVRAASLVEAQIRARPDSVLGLAAGATPLALYALLTDPARGIDFSRVTLFSLDDYLGIGADHPAGCGRMLRTHFVDKGNFAPQRVHLLDGQVTGDIAAHCAAHEAAIRQAGGIDLQILGLGGNGHIGFNEPGSGLGERTRLVALSARTRKANAPGFAPAPVPPVALTMGIGTICEARRLLLLATGPAKAEAVRGMVEGPVTARLPASALQLHPDAVIMLDEAAADGLALKEDYKEQDRVLRQWSPVAPEDEEFGRSHHG
jgi:glucosamine-6-phosphate deaminase